MICSNFVIFTHTTCLQDRSKVTGRVVPRHTLEMALDQVPRSVQVLAPLTDFFCELHNPQEADEVEITTQGLTWDAFKRIWAKTCPRPEERRRKST